MSYVADEVDTAASLVEPVVRPRRLPDKPHRRGRAAAVLAPLVLLGIVAVVWQVVASHNPDVLPGLGAIGRELARHPGEYGANALVTLEEVAVGLVAAFAVAFPLAVAMCQVPLLERAFMPFAVVVNVTPVVSIVPGLVVVFGFSMTPRYIVAGLIVFFPLLINSLVGLKSVDPAALEIFRTLNASSREILVHLRLPSSLPYLAAAARICVPLALVGAVVGEFVAPGLDQYRGLGKFILSAEANVDLPALYAGVLCLAAIGLVLTAFVTVLERRLLVWHPSQRRER
jgi:NitT/TauT family transport system permease protein